MKHREIYKRDSKGRTRVWSVDQDGDAYRTRAGILGGNLVISGWTTCIGKQGRTDEEQATFEVEAAYKHKLTREYHEGLEDIQSGAHFFKPMLAQKFEGFPGRCYAQPKLDGIRCIATAAGLFSREGKPITAVPHIHAALDPIFTEHPGIVLDGELYNHEFREDFGEISSIVRKKDPTIEQLERAEAVMQYHVYDLPSIGDNPFCTRTEELSRLLAELDCAWIIPVQTVHVGSAELLDELYGQWIEAGWEGQMVRLDAPYEQKRSKTLLKRKEFLDAEFECVAIEEGNGNWAGVAKRVSCRLPDGRIFGAGIKGDRRRAAELLNEKHNVVTVKYFQLSPDGVPRFPVVTKFHGAERTL